MHFQRRDTFAENPDILATSLLACASLGLDYSSTDFDLTANRAARVCAGQRFIARVLDPKFDRLTHVVLLGRRGRDAAESLQAANGHTVSDALKAAENIILNLPHPSGENRTYTQLAKLSAKDFPQREPYVQRKWAEYRVKPAKKNKKKLPESTYKSRQAAAWDAINNLRLQISSMDK